MNDRVHLFLSPEHPCGYLQGRVARNAYIDPALPLSATRYGWLLEQGFRRAADLEPGEARDRGSGLKLAAHPWQALDQGSQPLSRHHSQPPCPWL